jgi:6-phosphogluconate dehydrogenase (decarboxylating)
LDIASNFGWLFFRILRYRIGMQIGMIGLGRMGGNMARRLTMGGHQCVVFDRNRESIDDLAKEGPVPAYSLEEMVKKLTAPRAVWVMLPSGTPTEETVIALSKLLKPGDAIIDGGNSFYKDDVRRSAMLKPAGIHYLDAGTSGESGVWNAVIVLWSAATRRAQSVSIRSSLRWPLVRATFRRRRAAKN